MDEFRKLGHEWSKIFFRNWDMRGPKFGENLAHVRFLTFFVSLLTGSQNGLVKFFIFFYRVNFCQRYRGLIRKHWNIDDGHLFRVFSSKDRFYFTSPF